MFLASDDAWEERTCHFISPWFLFPSLLSLVSLVGETKIRGEDVREETWMQLREFKCTHCSLSWKLKSFKTVCTFVEWPNIFQRMLNIFRSLPVGAFKDHPTSKEAMFYCFYKTPIILVMPLMFAWFIYLLNLLFWTLLLLKLTQLTGTEEMLLTDSREKTNNRGAINLRYTAFASTAVPVSS